DLVQGFVRATQIVQVTVRACGQCQAEVTQISREWMGLGTLLAWIHVINPPIAIVLVKILSVINTRIFCSLRVEKCSPGNSTSLAVSGSVTVYQHGRRRTWRGRHAFFVRPAKILPCGCRVIYFFPRVLAHIVDHDACALRVDCKRIWIAQPVCPHAPLLLAAVGKRVVLRRGAIAVYSQEFSVVGIQILSV